MEEFGYLCASNAGRFRTSLLTHRSVLMLAEQPGYLRCFTLFAILKYICAFHRMWMRKLRLWEEGKWGLKCEAGSQWEFKPLTNQPLLPLSKSAGFVGGPLPTVRSEVLRLLLLRSHMGFSPNQQCLPFHLRPCSSLLYEGPPGAL